MKHGIKLRKLGRTSSHRGLLLRNLVSALLHHETIKTTVPKAKEAQRMAEKIITLGKRGTDPARRQAEAYLLPSHHYSLDAPEHPVPTPRPQGYPSSSSSSSSSSTPEILEADETFIAPRSLLPKLFTTLSERYQARPGGYTRLQRFGNRPGDNAPLAILSLVDGPRDLKFEMAARSVGVESVRLAMRSGEKGLAREGAWTGLREFTKRSAEKVLKYRGEEGKQVFNAKASAYADSLMMESSALNGLRRPNPEQNAKPFPAAEYSGIPQTGRRLRAGERLPGTFTSRTGLGLARGVLGAQRGRGAWKEGMEMRFLDMVEPRDPSLRAGGTIRVEQELQQGTA